LPAANASEQFIAFISLVSWLLSVNNHQVSGWNKYDDPTTASQNVVIECKKLGLDLSMSPNKLKNGHGEEVCVVLMSLCQLALKNKFRFKKPVIRDEGAGLDDEADELNGDEMDGGADLADEIHADNSDEDIDEDMDLGGVAGIQADMAKQMEAEMAANAIIYSGITKEKWMIEVERVAHKLKVNKGGNDGKEWRSHLD
jgi:intraflagellar transport protein 57